MTEKTTRRFLEKLLSHPTFDSELSANAIFLRKKPDVVIAMGNMCIGRRRYFAGACSTRWTR